MRGINDDEVCDFVRVTEAKVTNYAFLFYVKKLKSGRWRYMSVHILCLVKLIKIVIYICCLVLDNVYFSVIISFGLCFYLLGGRCSVY